MTVEEDCFYRRALDQCWLRRGGIPDDTARLISLLRLTPAAFKRCKWVLERFFYQCEEGYRNTRCDKLLQEAANYKAAASNGAKKTNAKRWGKSSPSDSPSDTGSESPGVSPYGRTSPSPSPATPFPSEKKTQSAPWPLFRESVEALFGETTSQAMELKRFRLIGELAALGATPGELVTRTAHYRLCWPDVACTLQAVLNNWDSIPNLKPKVKPDAKPFRSRIDGINENARHLDRLFGEAENLGGSTTAANGALSQSTGTGA